MVCSPISAIRIAHEDNAERAVRAALSIIDAVASLRNVSAALQTRIGIATGTVVVSELLIDEHPNGAGRRW